MTRAAFPLRYLFIFSACALLAFVPWVLASINSPLPGDLQETGTALAATRTGRIVTDPVETEETNVNSAWTASATSTATPPPTAQDTPTRTLTPSVTATPTISPTGTPQVLGVASATVNDYTCPGRQFRQDELAEGVVFTILGWDEIQESGEAVTYLLIEDEVGFPQRWIQDSEFLVLTIQEYKDFLPNIVCRTTR